MGELAPGGTNAKMTPAQVRKYIRDMKIAQQKAQKKLDEAVASGELNKDENELKILEEKLKNLF